MADLTVGIAGTGRMAARMMQAFAVVPGLRAVAVASGDPARARAFAEAHGLTPAGSVAEMAATVDLVYVAGRVRDHLPAARAAIAAGRPVLAEKPLAATAAEAREMVEAARAADVLLIEDTEEQILAVGPGRSWEVALDAIDLSLGKGVFGLLGPNGAGKTTTIQMLLDVVSPTSGEIFILGMPLRVTIGKRGYENGEIELVERATKEKRTIAPDEVFQSIKSWIANQ